MKIARVPGLQLPAWYDADRFREALERPSYDPAEVATLPETDRAFLMEAFGVSTFGEALARLDMAKRTQRAVGSTDPLVVKQRLEHLKALARRADSIVFQARAGGARRRAVVVIYRPTLGRTPRRAAPRLSAVASAGSGADGPPDPEASLFAPPAPRKGAA